MLGGVQQNCITLSPALPNPACRQGARGLVHHGTMWSLVVVAKPPAHSAATHRGLGEAACVPVASEELLACPRAARTISRMLARRSSASATQRSITIGKSGLRW